MKFKQLHFKHHAEIDKHKKKKLLNKISQLLQYSAAKFLFDIDGRDGFVFEL